MGVDWLRQNSSKYDKVAVADVRDIMFQRNPFPGLASGVHIAGEQVGRGNFGYGGFAAPLNRRWIGDIFNSLRKCGKQYISPQKTQLETYDTSEGVYGYESPFHTFGIQIGESKQMISHFSLVLDIWQTVVECKDKIFTGHDKRGEHYGLDQVSLISSRMP